MERDDSVHVTEEKETLAASKVSDQAIRTAVLRASFANRNEGTILTSKYHTAPIKIAKTFPLNGQLAVIVMDVSPGLLAGDRYELEWISSCNSHVMITNQSYMKVHPSMPSCGSSMIQTFKLDESAIVEHMPEPLMLYKNASFQNETFVELKRGAVWMHAEVLCPGRTLRGEQFDYRSYRNTLTVRYEDELIFTQRQRIEPANHVIHAPGCWDELTHLAAFYIFSDNLSSIHLELIQQKLEDYKSPFGHVVIAGASMTFRFGIAVSAASTAAWPLQQLMREVWDTIREVLLDMRPLRFLQ